MAKGQWIIEDDIQQDKPQESYLQQAKRIGTSAGLQALKGVESLGSIPTDIRDYLYGIKSPVQKPSEFIEKEAGLTPEYLQPRNVGERYLQRLANFAPLAAGGGLGALGRTAAGTGIATLLGEVGAPEPVKDIAQFGTELALGRVPKDVPFLGKLGGTIPSIRGAQKLEDSLMRAAVKPESKARSNLIMDAIKTVEEKLTTEVNKEYSNQIKNAIRTIGQNITKGEINPTKAVDLRKTLYKLGSKLPKDISAAYIEPLTTGINNFFSVYAAENPTFYKHLSARDKLTSLKNMNSVAGNLVTKLQLGKLPGGELATDIVNSIITEGERFSRGIIGNSAARKYYFDAITSGIKSNPSLFIKNINKLPGKIPELRKENNTSKGNWIIED